MVVAPKRWAAKVLLPDAAGPHSTSSVLCGTLIRTGMLSPLYARGYATNVFYSILNCAILVRRYKSSCSAQGILASCLSTGRVHACSARSNIPGHTCPEAIIQLPPESGLDIFQHHTIRE